MLSSIGVSDLLASSSSGMPCASGQAIRGIQTRQRQCFARAVRGPLKTCVHTYIFQKLYLLVLGWVKMKDLNAAVTAQARLR